MARIQEVKKNEQMLSCTEGVNKRRREKILKAQKKGYFSLYLQREKVEKVASNPLLCTSEPRIVASG